MALIVIVIRIIYRHRLVTNLSDTSDIHNSLPALDITATTGTFYAPVLKKSLVVIVLLLIAFLAGVSVPLAAYIAACALLFTRRIKSDKILNLIDWPLLLLFSGLFVVTGALELTGVSQLLFAQVSALAQAGVAPLLRNLPTPPTLG